jgi:hypothetical protein
MMGLRLKLSLSLRLRLSLRLAVLAVVAVEAQCQLHNRLANGQRTSYSGLNSRCQLYRPFGSAKMICHGM